MKAVFDGNGVPRAFFEDDDPRGAEAVSIGATQWQELIDNPGARCYVDGVVLPYTPPPLPVIELRRAAGMRIVSELDAIGAQVTGRYPAAEVSSWATQEAEAKALLATPEGQTCAAPWMDALAAATGVTPREYASGIIANATAYRMVLAGIIGLRSKGLIQIEAAKTAAALAKVEDGWLAEVRQFATGAGLKAP